MERRAGGENVSKGEDEAENKSEAEERMRCKSGGPHFVGIDASDENLAIREFESPSKDVFANETTRHSGKN